MRGFKGEDNDSQRATRPNNTDQGLTRSHAAICDSWQGLCCQVFRKLDGAVTDPGGYVTFVWSQTKLASLLNPVCGELTKLDKCADFYGFDTHRFSRWLALWLSSLANHCTHACTAVGSCHSRCFWVLFGFRCSSLSGGRWGVAWGGGYLRVFNLDPLKSSKL